MRNIMWKYGNIIKKMELELVIWQRFGNEQFEHRYLSPYMVEAQNTCFMSSRNSTTKNKEVTLMMSETVSVCHQSSQ